MRPGSRQQPPDAGRSKACGGNRGGGTLIWRERHGRDATTPRAVFGPWLAMTRRRTTQPEPAACPKNVVEPSSTRHEIAAPGARLANPALKPLRAASQG